MIITAAAIRTAAPTPRAIHRPVLLSLSSLAAAWADDNFEGVGEVESLPDRKSVV